MADFFKTMLDISKMEYTFYIMIHHSSEKLITEIENFLDEHSYPRYTEEKGKIIYSGANNQEDYFELRKFLVHQFKDTYYTYVKPFRYIIEDPLSG